MSTPNIYADQIEWFSRHTSKRESMILSLHPHNDRGTAVAATELALLAGADRVEGTLFGNGERTGNVDIVTLAINMYSQGLHPGLDFSRINDVIECAEFCTQLPVHPRHPYAGDSGVHGVLGLASGRHQEGIRGAEAGRAAGRFPTCPSIRRISAAATSRSFASTASRAKAASRSCWSAITASRCRAKLQIEFSRVIQQITDATGREITSAEIWRAFKAEYHRPGIAAGHSRTFRALRRRERETDGDRERRRGGARDLRRRQRPDRCFCSRTEQALRSRDSRILDYDEHAVGSGADAAAVCFVELRAAESDAVMGAGMHRNILTASLNAITSALNRAVRDQIIGTAEGPRSDRNRFRLDVQAVTVFGFFTSIPAPCSI